MCEISFFDMSQVSYQERASTNGSLGAALKIPRRNRERSDSDMEEIFSSGMQPNVSGFKRQLGHRCVILFYEYL